VTDDDWSALAAYIRRVADELGLRDWELRLLRDPPHATDDSSHILAHVNVLYGRRFASIKVCTCFRGESPDDQRMTIVHELIHCHLDQTAQVISGELLDMGRLCQSEYNAIKSAHHRAIENATDAIAVAVAARLPVIEWPKPAPAKLARTPRRA
jgi:hypothetical protein